jgi:hypothetical protein
MKKFYISLLTQLFIIGSLSTQPTITSFSPKKGNPGTIVTITGTNFNFVANSNIVYFGATRGIVLSSTTTSITVLSPVGATYRPISVQNFSTGLWGTSKKFFTPTFSPKNTNMSSGDFLAKVDYPTTALHPTSVAAADISIASKSAILYTTDFSAYVLNFGNANTFYMANNSITGTIDSFSFPGSFPLVYANSRPQALAYGDIDFNTTLDVAIAAYSGNDVSYHRAVVNVNGELNPCPGPIDVAICDMDLDGKQDIVTANALGFGISIFKNSGAQSSFAFVGNPFNFVTGFQPFGLAIGDIDGDGKEDVAVININTDSTAGLSVLRNTSIPGTLSFAPVATFTTGPHPKGIAFADIDGDDKLDVVVANQKRNTVSILRNTSVPGNISFAAKVNFTVGNKPKSVAVGDLNGDGKPDIVVANTKGNTVSVLQNQATLGTIDATSLATQLTFTTGALPVSVAVADLDGDGKSDIISANYNGNSISVIKNEPVIIGAPKFNAIAESTQDRFSQFLQSNKDKPNNLNANLYPNPAVNFATLSFNSQSIPVAVRLTDMKGNILWEKQEVQINILQVPVSNLAPGMYFISITSNLNNATLKLVKQ